MSPDRPTSASESPPHVIIDGNNLLYAMYEHTPLPMAGRETLARIVRRWAQNRAGQVTLVFDGAVPGEGILRQMQMTSDRVSIRFSAPESADDVIIRMIDRAPQPTALHVVSGDGVIRHAARYRRCQVVDSGVFVAELFSADRKAEESAPVSNEEKPARPSRDEVQKWLQSFDVDEYDEPFDGYDAMALD